MPRRCNSAIRPIAEGVNAVNGYFNECDRLGAEIKQRAVEWHQPARVPNVRAAAFLSVVCAVGGVLAALL